MKPATNLTPSRIKQWAYRKSDDLPLRFEEIQTVLEHGELLLSLASDPNCPQRAYILNCLYSLVGRSVSKHVTPDISLIMTLLNKAATNQNTVILNWVTRSRLILRDLRKYDYVEWCDGGFVRKDLS